MTNGDEPPGPRGEDLVDKAGRDSVCTPECRESVAGEALKGCDGDGYPQVAAAIKEDWRRTLRRESLRSRDTPHDSVVEVDLEQPRPGTDPVAAVGPPDRTRPRIRLHLQHAPDATRVGSGGIALVNRVQSVQSGDPDSAARVHRGKAGFRDCSGEFPAASVRPKAIDVLACRPYVARGVNC
jgi:hypothetical protein